MSNKIGYLHNPEDDTEIWFPKTLDKCVTDEDGSTIAERFDDVEEEITEINSNLSNLIKKETQSVTFNSSGAAFWLSFDGRVPIAAMCTQTNTKISLGYNSDGKYCAVATTYNGTVVAGTFDVDFYTVSL